MINIRSEGRLLMFFGVVAKRRTWSNIGYLLLAFPLGIFYFVFLVTGLSLGFGLFITLLGIPILVGVLAAAYGLGEFERATTNMLLEQNTPPSYRLAVAGGWWPKVKSLIGSSETWKRIGYLFAEFPFGIIGFTLVATTAAVFGLVVTPFVYTRSWWTDAWFLDSIWVVDTLWEAVVVAVAAIVLGFVLIHVMNWVAGLWGMFAKAMLGPSHRPTAVAESSATHEEARSLHETRG